MEICECAYWARTDGFITTHHPNCSHYQDGIIDIWRITANNKSCYTDKEEDIIEIKNNDPTVIIIKEKMHREVYEKMPEFDGF